MGKQPKKEHWKAKKGKGPDVGTYEDDKVYREAVSRRPTSAVVMSEKGKTFTDQAIKAKRGAPVGTYNYVPCYDKISRPMRAGRR